MGMGSDYSNRIAAGLETLLGSDYSQGALSNSADDADGVRSRLNYRLASLELRRQKNIEDVLLSVYSLFTFLDDVEDERDSNDLGDISFSPINSD